MASAQHHETVRAIDSLRQRFQSLATSMAKLIHDLSTLSPLPPYPALLNSWALLNHNFLSATQILLSEKFAPLLRSAHVHPMPSYPGRTQEDLLTQLVRKKNQPAVEDWLSDGKALFGKQRVASGEEVTRGEAEAMVEQLGLKLQELEEVWNWAGIEANRIAREEVGPEGWDDVFTLAESELGIENVVTGLRRKLWESEGEESDEDDDSATKKDKKSADGDVMDVDGKDGDGEVERNPDGLDYLTNIMMSRSFEEGRPPLPLETILRMQLTGQFVIRR